LPGTSYKFDVFELDSAKFELRRGGRPLKLERIPMELLILLAEREGNVVSRQEIVERLWGKDVFVDTEHGINVAVRKIRAALGDDADRPRFVQTVLGKGYRFVGEASVVDIVRADLDRRADDPTEIGIPIEAPSGSGSWGAGIAALGGFVMFAFAVVAFNVGGIADRMLEKPPSTQIRSIAVIPLANLSGDASQDYFADGMTDEIITMLAKNSSLRVVSRTSAMQYKGAKRPLREIAHELGVDGILEGSIGRTGNRVHMTVQLIHAPSDSHVWAESYDRDFNDAFSLPVELSQTIAKQIRLSTSSPVTAKKGVSPEAHDAYLRGRYFWFGTNMIRSQEEFKKAIQIQPDYALAWGGLADAYTVQAVDSDVPVKDIRDKADAAGRKALELDDSLPEVHNAMAGIYLFVHWDPKHADEEAQKSIALNPNYAEIHHLRAYILLALNRSEEALREQKRCTELDRFERPWALGKVLTQLRKFDEAINEFHVLLEAQPTDQYAWFLLSDVYHMKGMMRESVQAKAHGARRVGDPKGAEAIERAFRAGGDKAVQDWDLNRIKKMALKGYVSPMTLAFVAARGGRRDEALKYLEEAYEERSPWLVLLQNEPDFDLLHGEPRYREIVKKLGLSPAY